MGTIHHVSPGAIKDRVNTQPSFFAVLDRAGARSFARELARVFSRERKRALSLPLSFCRAHGLPLTTY